jgi:hypothetical protein
MNNVAKNTSWITSGIKTSCRQEELYLASKNSNNSTIQEHYKSYCKIQANVIKETKRLNYDTQIINLNDAIKTTWEIVKLKMGRKANNGNIHPFNVASRMINNQQNIADTFNNYFLSITENIKVNKNT